MEPRHIGSARDGQKLCPHVKKKRKRRAAEVALRRADQLGAGARACPPNLMAVFAVGLAGSTRQLGRPASMKTTLPATFSVRGTCWVVLNSAFRCTLRCSRAQGFLSRAPTQQSRGLGHDHVRQKEVLFLWQQGLCRRWLRLQKPQLHIESSMPN